jgi:8-amino-7-oxononanoate synthase
VGMNTPRTLESAVGAEIVVDGQRYINFAGSSYLGLSGRPETVAAGVAALRESGSGYQFPRHHGIATRAHQDVESEAAAFFATQAAIYLASGYYFGLVAIASVRDDFDAIFFDELCHYSLREAIAASGLPSHSYRHLDVEDLATNLKRHLRAQHMPLIVTDGMYSTFGEIAPLDELARVMAPYDGCLLVDESHSFGVLGQSGRGAVEHHRLADASILSGGSLCKAFGGSGGIIPAQLTEIEACRSTPAGRGAAAGLPANAAMCATNLRYVREHPELLKRLRSNVAYLKNGLRNLGLEIPDTVAPVAAFVPGAGESIRALHQQLMAEGIFVFHSKYIGAGPAGAIRCGIFADHTTLHADRLVDALRRLL